jgi:hypothetical protein
MKIIKVRHVDPGTLMAFGFFFSIIIGPILIIVAPALTYIGISRTGGMTLLWYFLFVLCSTFGHLFLGWLLNLALFWCKGINVGVADEKQ